MSTDNPTAEAAAAPTSGTWFDTASTAFRSGVSDAQQTAEKILPTLGAALSKGMYGLGYGLGYGVAFPAVLVAKVLPQENCVAWGLIDGAHVAHDTAYRNQNQS